MDQDTHTYIHTPSGLKQYLSFFFTQNIPTVTHMCKPRISLFCHRFLYQQFGEVRRSNFASERHLVLSEKVEGDDMVDSDQAEGGRGVKE